MSSKRCPSCSGDIFVAKIIRGAAVKSNEDGTFTILKEIPEYELEILKCNKCKSEVSEADLVEAVLCTRCGLPVNQKNINKEGVCDVCLAIESREDLANATKEDVIRMVLTLERQVATSKSMTIDSKLKHGEDVKEKTETTKAKSSAPKTTEKEIVKEASKEESKDIKKEDPSDKKDVKPTATKRKRNVRKASTTKKKAEIKKEVTDEPEETTEEVKAVEVTENPVVNKSEQDIIPSTEEAVQQISEDQAPFPDTEDDLNVLFDSANKEDTAPKGFAMFDESEPEF